VLYFPGYGNQKDIKQLNKPSRTLNVAGIGAIQRSLPQARHHHLNLWIFRGVTWHQTHPIFGSYITHRLALIQIYWHTPNLKWPASHFLKIGHVPKSKTGSRGYAHDMINIRTKFEDSSVTHSKVKQDDQTFTNVGDSGWLGSHKVTHNVTIWYSTYNFQSNTHTMVNTPYLRYGEISDEVAEFSSLILDFVKAFGIRGVGRLPCGIELYIIYSRMIQYRPITDTGPQYILS